MYPTPLKTEDKVKFYNQKTRLISTIYLLVILKDRRVNDYLGLLVFHTGVSKNLKQNSAL